MGFTTTFLLISILAAVPVLFAGQLSWGSNHGLFPGEACEKGKLAVIEVSFAAGELWKLKP